MSNPEQSIKFLLIAPSYACLTITGAGQRTNLIYQSLNALGNVDIVLVGQGGYLPALKKSFPHANLVHQIYHLERGQLGWWKFIRPLFPALVDKIATALGRRSVQYQPDQQISNFISNLLKENSYDFIVGRYLRSTVFSGVLQQTSIPVILDIDDLDDSVLRSRLNQPNLNHLVRLVLMWQVKQI